MPSVISGDANVSATEFGYLDGVTSALQSQMDSKLPLAGGKILQIVRATDSTLRSTTSTSFVDASLSVSITPSLATSAILLIWTAQIYSSGTGNRLGRTIITDNSNNTISGAGESSANTVNNNSRWSVIEIGYSTPATTSATTYKARFRSEHASTTIELRNADKTGQLFAIEVSA